MPDFVMRRFVLQSLILILAASGIACACPSDSIAADQTEHETHQSHSEPSKPECCEDCDNAVSMHSEGLPVAIDIRFFAEDFDNAPAWLPVAIDIVWSSGNTANKSPPGTSNLPPNQTPVIRHDRMLN